MLYLVSCCTGAVCQGVYSTLQLAQEAVEKHYALIGGTAEVQWSQISGAWEASACSYMEDILVVALELDAPLPTV